jgi:hypothetical protein
MDPNARTPAPTGTAGHRHIDQAALASPHIPERQRSAMAEQGVWAACEHGGHPNPFESEFPVTHGVHPSVDPVQMPARDPILHEMPAEPLPEQLTTGDDSVLPPADHGKRPIDKRALCRYMRY